jgi:lactoylglutathione lyase
MRTFGGSNHIALEVPDLASAVTTLQARPAFKAYGKPIPSSTAPPPPPAHD